MAATNRRQIMSIDFGQYRICIFGEPVSWQPLLYEDIQKVTAAFGFPFQITIHIHNFYIKYTARHYTAAKSVYISEEYKDSYYVPDNPSEGKPDNIAVVPKPLMLKPPVSTYLKRHIGTPELFSKDKELRNLAKLLMENE